MGIWIINELLLPVLRERIQEGGGGDTLLAATCAWYFASRQTHKIYALAKKWGKAGATGGAAAAGRGAAAAAAQSK